MTGRPLEEAEVRKLRDESTRVLSYGRTQERMRAHKVIALCDSWLAQREALMAHRVEFLDGCLERGMDSVAAAECLTDFEDDVAIAREVRERTVADTGERFTLDDLLAEFGIDRAALASGGDMSTTDQGEK